MMLRIRSYHRWDIVNCLHEEIPFNEHHAKEIETDLTENGILELAAYRLVSRWSSNIQWPGHRFVYWIE